MSEDGKEAGKTGADWRGISDFRKYDKFVEGNPDGWWDLDGPMAGLHVLNRARVAYFREKLGGFQNQRVLDVGCGGGILSESLAGEGARVVAIDPSRSSVEAARRHAAARGLEIDYRVGFAEKMDLKEIFDAVFAVDVLEHVEDLDGAVRACAGALKRGGLFGFLTHNQTLEAFRFLIWEQEYQERSMPKGAHDFHKFITPADLEASLDRAGIELVDVRGLSRSGRGANYQIEVSDDLSISYLGYGRKC